MTPIHSRLTVSVVLLLLCSHSGHSQDDEDDVKGPLMPVKPDGMLYTTEELITFHKRHGESHSVETHDGYQLTLFRIKPDKMPASPVLLQHGFLVSSDCWVTDPDSLAFKLSDAGFDVWLGNVRGNAYSRRHVKLKPTDKEFWNFSFHEMGTTDIPSMIDYILRTTGQKMVHYIGHSMGSTVSYVMLSTHPEYNEKLKSLVSLAPVAFLNKMAEMVGPEGMAGQMAAKYMMEFKESGKAEVFPKMELAIDNKTQITCQDVEESFRDMCSDKMEETHKVLGGAYIPAGQSFKTLEHFYQIGCEGVMKYYNAGSAEENKKIYGSELVPAYSDKFNLVTVPTLLWSTEADQIVVEKDVDDLKAKLPNVVADNRIKDSDCFDHVAFLFPQKKSCIPLRATLYKDIIEAITKLDKK